MTQPERDTVTEFVASMGFEATRDLMSLTDSICSLIDGQREIANRRAAQLASEWAPGGWRREGEAQVDS